MYTFKVIPAPRFKSYAMLGKDEDFFKDLKEWKFIIDSYNHSKTLISTSIMAWGTSRKVNRKVDGIKQKFYSAMNYWSWTRTQEYLFKSLKSQGFEAYTKYLTAILSKLDIPKGTEVQIWNSRAVQSMVWVHEPVQDTIPA